MWFQRSILYPLVALVFLPSLLDAQVAPKPESAGAAQTKINPPKAPAAPLLDPKTVLEAARAITTEKYPDAKTVLVSKHVRTDYETNGAFVAVTEEYTKVLTEDGPLAGARVRWQASNRATDTDADGRFQLGPLAHSVRITAWKENLQWSAWLQDYELREQKSKTTTASR